MAPPSFGAPLHSASGLWVWSRTQTLLPYEAIIGSARAAALALAMQLILCANFVACALAAIAVACAVASLLALLVGCGWALGATEAALACLTPALVTAPAALVVRAYCLSGARRRGRRAAEAFVRAGAPVISGCFAMALGSRRFSRANTRKPASSPSRSLCSQRASGCGSACSFPPFSPPSVLDQEQARSSRRHSGSPQCCSGSAASGSRRVELRLGRPDGCGSDGGCATSPRLKRTRERLSRAFPPPPAASPSPRDVPFRAADRRPPPAAPRPEVVAAPSGRARWPPVVPSRQRRPWPLPRPSRSARTASCGLAALWRRLRASGHEQAVGPDAAHEFAAIRHLAAGACRRTQKHAASAAASSDSCEHRGGGDGGRRSVALARSFPSEPPGSGRGSGRRPPSARRLSLMGDELSPSAREARRASLAAQTPEDAIDNERLVSALAQDLLGRPWPRLAEVYGAHSRALLEA